MMRIYSIIFSCVFMMGLQAGPLDFGGGSADTRFMDRATAALEKRVRGYPGVDRLYRELFYTPVWIGKKAPTPFARTLLRRIEGDRTVPPMLKLREDARRLSGELRSLYASDASLRQKIEMELALSRLYLNYMHYLLYGGIDWPAFQAKLKELAKKYDAKVGWDYYRPKMTPASLLVEATMQGDLAAAFRLYPIGPASLNQDAPDDNVGADGEIEPMSVGIDVRESRAHPHTIGIVHGEGPEPGGVRVVVVIGLGVTAFQAGRLERILQRQPVLRLMAAHWHRAFRTVEIVLYIGIGLQLPKKWQKVDVAPLVVTPFSPPVVILGDTAQENLAVDGAGAAHHLSPGHGDLVGLGRSGGADERPVMRRAHLGCGWTVAVFYVVGKSVEVRVVRSRFKQQYRAVGVFGQPGCDGPSR
jgi:hypothetical protein